MKAKRILFSALALLLVIGMMPMSVFAAVDFDTKVSNDYFSVISKDVYNLAPGATETEMVLNNADGSDRKVVHVFEVDTKNENIEVLPGYYGIDKLDPDNLALNGIADKSAYWQAKELTKTVAYYESLGYNVVGAMNTALAYDSNAPYGYMVMNGVVLGTPEVHKGAQTYLAIDAEGNCELRSMSTPLNGTEVTAISANFGWLVKDGKLTSTNVERTSSDASRSMIGIKADGTLVFCQVDGRNAPISTGLSNYEMGEMMLSLGCVNAVNCDGGGSSTFVSKREGETENTMRSVPSDGSERPTINSVILVSKAKPTGEFDHAVLNSAYNYYAPGTSATILATGVDAAGSPAELPAEGITWALSDSSFGTVENGVFKSNGKKGNVTVQMFYNGKNVGEKTVSVVDPDVFALSLDETVLPYGKSMTIDFACTYGVDDWEVCVDGAYSLVLSNTNAATLNGNVLVATNDESITGVNVTATYIPDPAITDVLKVTYGKGSEIIYDFEDGTTSGFVNFDDAKEYCKDNGINNTLVGNSPLAGQFSEEVDGKVFVSENIVRNGKYALAWSVDNTNAAFAQWTYNVLFNIGDTIVLRDVENGKNATALGMWLYIPEGAAGLAFQAQLYTKSGNTLTHFQAHYTFRTANGTVKNLNSCTEADIPESRWVYASINLTGYDYVCTPVASLEGNNRTPSFIRTYVKPTVPAVHTFYIDDITLDYSSAVDDRIAPTISDVSYATQDESVALENGVTINGNSVSFSAGIADNLKLDYTTGKIFVDGNALANVSASGKYLTTTSAVTLAPGVHTVTFEIKDALGNPAKVTRTFTIAGEASVVLGGHNDSGSKPEYGSVYYVDVNVADIASVNKLQVSLLLQDANTWEPQGITVADGFKVTYSLDTVENILTLTIERNGEAIDETATAIVSVPVRLWTWDGVNHVTGVPVAPETQYATGDCPVVKVDCKVTQGIVNDTDSFGGSISVETMINDTVTPWHYHDAELTVLNQAATCTKNGYANRTYCETCKSVVDWGTVMEATGHDYVVNGDVLVCAKGDSTVNTTGLFEANGKIYCLINGKLVTGWQNVDGKYVYVKTATKEVQVGEVTVSGITYKTDENGFVEPTWVTNTKGTKLSYGPKCYTREWVELDGEKYYFGTDSYMYTGLRAIVVNRNNAKEGSRIYTFAEDGKLIDEMLDYNGLITTPVDGMFYVENGTSVYGGLMLIDGYYYYARTSGEIVCGRSYGITKTNGLLPARAYTFGADGKMLDAPVVEPEQPDTPVVPEVKNGVCADENGKLFYYVNGVKTYGGLMLIDGDYYYARTSGEIVCSRSYGITKTNGLLPARAYTFGADGKMINPPTVDPTPDPEQPPVTPEPEVKNGVCADENGKLFYYVNGVKTYGGLMLIDGDYYYARTSGEIVCSRSYGITKTNGLLPARAYTFGADGKMLDAPVVEPEQPDTPVVPEVKNGVCADENGKLFYYVNGVKTYGGLMLIDGDYYYARTSGEIVCGRSYGITKTNGLLPARAYTFGADGKMLNPPA